MNPQDSQSELDEILLSLHLDCSINCPHTVEPESDWLKQAIEAYVTTRVKEAERLAREDENSRWKVVAEEIVKKDGVYRAVNYLNKRCQEIALTTTTNGKVG